MATLERFKDIGKSNYKHVRIYLYHGKEKYKAYIQKFHWCCFFDSEKDAAIAVDKYLLSKGLEPVNILKKKL